MNKETVQLNYLHIAPRKVRLIANALKGLSANEAEAQLTLRPQRASEPLLKLLQSAMANARHNRKINADRLVIDSIQVNQGPIFKRFMPRAMGRATPIHKKTSHVVLTLKEAAVVKAPRFNIIIEKPEKKEKKAKKPAAPKSEAKREMAKPKEKAGFFRKIFNRKSI